MSQDKTPDIIFIAVRDNNVKLQRICEVVHHHFYNNHRILILVPSEEASAYIDQLLWRMPEDSFVPHEIAKGVVQSKVAITTLSSNINQASILMNLCATIASQAQAFDTVYELMDQTHPSKEALSQKRIAEYQAKGWQVSLNN